MRKVYEKILWKGLEDISQEMRRKYEKEITKIARRMSIFTAVILAGWLSGTVIENLDKISAFVHWMLSYLNL